MLLIINWSGYDDIELVRNEDGWVMLFKTEEEAVHYAESELNFNWKAVKV